MDTANFMGLCQAFVPANSIGFRNEKAIKRIAAQALVTPNQKRTSFLFINSDIKSISKNLIQISEMMDSETITNVNDLP